LPGIFSRLALSSFDGYDRGALPSEFHGEETLERSQIEDAQSLDRPVREVCHELYHSPDTSLVPACSPNGVEIVLELQVCEIQAPYRRSTSRFLFRARRDSPRPQTVNDRVNSIRNLAWLYAL
jgi:hypothetical protein